MTHDRAPGQGLEQRAGPAHSCDQPAHFDFGTGFFPLETDAPKRDLETMSLRRDRKSETTTREKWPQKRLFC